MIRKVWNTMTCQWEVQYTGAGYETWMRLNRDREPGRYSKWESQGHYSNLVSREWGPPWPFTIIYRLQATLPPECVSPGGKLRLPRPDLTVRQVIAAVRIIAKRPGRPPGDKQNVDEAINYVLDAPAEEIETMLEMAAMERLVAK